jgi:hypothetical protein
MVKRFVCLLRTRGSSRIASAVSRKADFARVRKVGLKVPGLEEGRAWNGPCLKASKKIAACMATHKSAEPGTLVVVVGEDVRDELIAGDPDVYYVKDHYLPWPTVLVRLALIDDGVLRDLLMMAARYRSADRAEPARPRKRL